MYDAIAIAFILVFSAAFYLAVKWAMGRRSMQQTDMYRLTIAIFSVIFVERLVRTIADPVHRGALDWFILIGSLAFVIVYGFRLLRAR